MAITRKLDIDYVDVTLCNTQMRIEEFAPIAEKMKERLDEILNFLREDPENRRAAFLNSGYCRIGAYTWESDAAYEKRCKRADAQAIRNAARRKEQFAIRQQKKEQKELDAFLKLQEKFNKKIAEKMPALSAHVKPRKYS